VQICLNGREWLARQLERRRSGFQRADNCFPWLAKPALAQRLMDQQLATDWPATLTAIARFMNPLHDEIFAPWPMDYYWSGYQTEWATDVMFKDPKARATIYPALVHHAIEHRMFTDTHDQVVEKTMESARSGRFHLCRCSGGQTVDMPRGWRGGRSSLSAHRSSSNRSVRTLTLLRISAS
jgi:hypothetical protein